MEFEEKLEGLENVVERLEAGDVALEEALTLFEQGVGLVRDLRSRLDDAEKRLEVLTRSADGELEIREADPAIEEGGPR